MRVFKLIYHIRAIVFSLMLKLIYRKRLSIGKRTTWRKSFSVLIDKDARVVIGNECFFNNNCSITSIQSVIIGDGCLFGENVKIYDHNHRFADTNVSIKKQGFSKGSVSIGNHCWIGSNVTILKDTKIGNNCVIGAGCVINGEISDNTIVKIERNFVSEKIRD